ncbi:DUF2975 domain-containing protein [Clostridium oryzae]|uniref:DUF2975 domain-containing protein n=1 Tax=Clostridium oryzae TaxID=1450648 RepID=A0A1V4IHH3_9CLOT|nr:DUF2975 domain-containing protein [Clostridium oryzae]OPJ59451.1 hypothetical protein CLORY_32930 [Clostridium oryzae]
MNQLKLSKWLKAILIGAGICGTIIYLYIFPSWGRGIAVSNPEFEYCYWPWLVFLWITAIPCYATLVCGWKIVCEIGKDKSFSIKNANLLKLISIFMACDSAFFFAGNIIFLLLNMNHPGVVLLAFFATFAGIAITVTAAALSHLVYKAAKLREENELTI